jgi:hypothetical protein
MNADYAEAMCQAAQHQENEAVKGLALASGCLPAGALGYVP